MAVIPLSGNIEWCARWNLIWRWRTMSSWAQFRPEYIHISGHLLPWNGLNIFFINVHILLISQKEKQPQKTYDFASWQILLACHLFSSWTRRFLRQKLTLSLIFETFFLDSQRSSEIHSSLSVCKLKRYTRVVGSGKIKSNSTVCSHAVAWRRVWAWKMGGFRIGDAAHIWTVIFLILEKNMYITSFAQGVISWYMYALLWTLK